MSLDADSDFQGNSAGDGGAGGAIFWAHLGNLLVSCHVSTAIPLPWLEGAGSPNVSSDVQPCGTWELNTVGFQGYGPVMASTPFYLDPNITDIFFYSSNKPFLLDVAVKVRVPT